MSNHASTPRSFADLFGFSLQAFKKQPVYTILTILLSGLIAYAINFYISVFITDGIEKTQAYPFVWSVKSYQPDPQYRSFFFYLLTGFMVATLVSYWRSAGTKALIESWFGIPKRIGDLFKGNSAQSLALFLWGLALGLWLFGDYSPLFKLVLAISFLFFSLSIVGELLGSVLSGNKETPSPAASVFLVGLAAACLVALPLGLMSLSLRMALILGLVAWLSLRSPRSAANLFPFLLVVGFTAMAVFFPELALAHDGGWWESGGTVEGLQNSQGYDDAVSSGGVASVIGIGGGALGAPFGSAMGSFAPGRMAA